MTPTDRLSLRAFRLAAAAALLAAAAWRVGMAAALPVISRDGVTFCWYARDLGLRGPAFLRDPSADQHPLFPAAILLVQRVLRALGVSDHPLTWQSSGQLVSLVAGLAVIVLAGTLTMRLIRRLDLPLPPRLTGLLAMLCATVLDLNVWLSADVMSEQVHLAFYLAAVLLLIDGLASARAALACGLLTGLAFLARQEGFVPVLAGLALLVTQRRSTPGRTLAGRGAALLAGFLILAAPYWATVGRFSTKKDVLEGFRPAGSAVGFIQGGRAPVRTTDSADPQCVYAADPRLARLRTYDLPWYAVLPTVLERLLRAGRYVVPLLALFPLLTLRPRLLRDLAGYATCLAGHLTLAAALLARYGYLDPRHMLVPTMLLIPLAAMQLARLVGLLLDLHRRRLAVLLVAATLFPPALYALRVPNASEVHLRRAADWLQAQPDAASRTLLAGSSQRRIAFYSGLSWMPWYENPADYPILVRRIRQAAPGYLALETGRGFEREENAALLDRLRADPAAAAHLSHSREFLFEGGTLHLIALQP